MCPATCTAFPTAESAGFRPEMATGLICHAASFRRSFVRQTVLSSHGQSSPPAPSKRSSSVGSWISCDYFPVGILLSCRQTRLCKDGYRKWNSLTLLVFWIVLVKPNRCGWRQALSCYYSRSVRHLQRLAPAIHPSASIGTITVVS